jgi:phosphonate transport system permease protein
MKARGSMGLRGWLGASDRAALGRKFPGAFQAPLAGRAIGLALLTLALGVFLAGLWWLDFSVAKLWLGAGRLVDFVLLMVPPDAQTWAQASTYLRSLGETMAIALLGTLGAALIALPLSIFGTAAVVRSWLLRWPARRMFNTISGIDTLIWALIWINVVGLGPFAGVLAVMTSDLGALGRLFSETLEAADPKPMEGVDSTGGGTLLRIRFGLMPQVMPVMASQVLYFFESNTRSATIIGIVGAGGIGAHLSEQIRLLEWQQVSFIVALILAAVMTIDAISSRLRRTMIGRTQAKDWP